MEPAPTPFISSDPWNAELASNNVTESGWADFSKVPFEANFKAFNDSYPKKDRKLVEENKTVVEDDLRVSLRMDFA